MGTSVEPTNAAEADAMLESAFAEVAQAVEPEAPDAGADPSPEPSGPARDEQGRFVEAPPQEEPATPVAEAPAAESPEQLTDAVPPEPEVTPELFRYKGDGHEFDIPGSAVGEDGVFIPTQAIPQIQQLLAEGVSARGSVRQRLHEADQSVQSARQETESTRAQLNHLVNHITTMIEQSVGKPIEESAIWKWLAGDVQGNWAKLKAEAEVLGVKKQNEATAQRLAEYERRDRETQMEPRIQSAIGEAVKQYGDQYGLPEDVQRDLYQTLADRQNRSQVVVTATFDAPDWGVVKGQPALDRAFIAREVEKAARWVKRPPVQDKIAQAQARNAKANQPAKVPPVVGAKSTRAPQAPKVPQFKNAKEADEWFMAGGYNDIELDEER